MREETHEFVAGIVQDDRSVLEFLDADYSFLNERLAQHYGIAGVQGEQMRRVSLTGGERGGLLTQASILTITSLRDRTFPARRGKWVLENLLGTPVGAPPAGLLRAFQSQTRVFQPGTVRQLLTKHSSDPSCAHCHVKIDTIGFALENFDFNGAWRVRDNRRPIDVVVTLPGGESLQGPTQLKRYLREKPESFVRCLGEKLLSYALGRKLAEHETAEMDRLAKCVAGKAHRFSSVVLEVFKSDAFQTSCRKPRSSGSR